MFLIAGVTFAVPTIAQTYGLDSRLIWVPAICYSIWIIFTGIFKPRISFSHSLERSTIERIRGWSYVATLPFALILNAILIQYLLGSPYLSIISIIIIPAVGFSVAAADSVLIKSFFKKEIDCMNSAQKYLVGKMLDESGVASIWTSFSLLMLNLEFVFPKNLTTQGAIIGLFCALIIFYYSYNRNRESSQTARDLSESLTNSKWSKRYIATSKKRRQKSRGS